MKLPSSLIALFLSVSPFFTCAQLAAFPGKASGEFRLPLRFVENAGQIKGQGRSIPGYYARQGGSTFYFCTDGLLIDMQENVAREPGLRDNKPFKAHAVRMKFVDPEAALHIESADPLPAPDHYFIGNDPKIWKTGVASYGALHYRNVWNGIDLVYHPGGESNSQLKYDVSISAGADPSQIRFLYEGANSMEVDKKGNLLITTSLGEISELKPYAYQLINGQEKEVEADFVVNAVPGGHTVTFRLGDYDRDLPLVIDPVFCTFFPGVVYSMAVDAGENIFVAGTTTSAVFPTTPGSYDVAYNGGGDVFVAQLNPAGGALVFCTYFGSTGSDVLRSIKIDGTGIYLAGIENGLDMPVTPGAYQPAPSVNSNIFAAKLNLAGNALLYSTYLGGAGIDYCHDMQIDATGRMYLVGTTFFNNTNNFPTTPAAYQPSHGAGYTGFVSVINPAGAGAVDLVYSSFFGAGATLPYSCINAVDVDAANNIYITGIADSDGLPVTPGAFQAAYRRGDATVSAVDNMTSYVAKLDPSAFGAAGLVYCTYLGGAPTHPTAILEDNGNVYVAGATRDTLFPVSPGAFQNKRKGNYDLFVTKLNTTGTAVLYSTYIGGTGMDGGMELTGNALQGGSGTPKLFLGPSGELWLTGQTQSGDFPLSACPMYNSGIGFFLRLANTASSLPYSTYYKGIGREIVVNGRLVYLAGGSGPGLTATPGAFSTVAGPGFVSKFNFFPAITAPPSFGMDTLFCKDEFAEKDLVITNTGDTCLVITNISLSGTDSVNFVLQPQVFPHAIPPFSSKTYKIRLVRSGTGGAKTASLSFFSTDTIPLGDTLKVVTLSGYIDTSFITVISGSPQVCLGDSIVLSVTGGDSFQWSTGHGNVSTISVKPAKDTTISVLSTYGYCQDEDTHTIKVYPIPTADFTVVSPLCAGKASDIVYTGTAGSMALYTWSFDGGTVNSGAGQGPYSIEWSTPGTRTLTLVVTENGCTSATKSQSVTVQQDDASFSYASGTYCASGTHPLPTITGLSGGSFSAMPASLVISASTGKIDLSASPLGSYTVTYTTNGSCPSSKSFTIKITDAPDASFSYSGPYCKNGTPNPLPGFPPNASAGTFSATPAGLLFVNPSTGQIDLTASAPGSYTVTNTIAAAGGCAADVKTNTVVIRPVPTAVFDVAASVCSGEELSVKYTGNAASSAAYTWGFDGAQVIAGSGAGPYLVVWSSPGTREISLAVTEAGCTSAPAKKMITVQPRPFASITGPDTLFICPGDSAAVNMLLSGSAPWSVTVAENGSTRQFQSNSDQAVVYAKAEGWFWLVAAEDQFCDTSFADSICILHYEEPALQVTYPLSVCAGAEAEVVLDLQGSFPLFDLAIDNGRATIANAGDGERFTLTVNSDTVFYFTGIGYSGNVACQAKINIPVAISIYEDPRIENLEFDCNGNNDAYQVSFDITGGDAASYTVNAAPSGPSYASAWITAGTPYSFEITDGNRCRPVLISGVHSCECTSDAGTAADNNPIDICEDLPARYPHKGDQVLDGNDLLEFLLHDGTSATIGNILFRSSTGIFTFQAGVAYNTTYYITPVAGNDAGNGQVDLNDPCLSEGEGIAVIYRQVPDISIQAVPNDSLCIDDVLQFQLAFSGVGPYSIDYLKDGSSFSKNNLTDPSLLDEGSQSASSLYRFTRVADQYCAADIDHQLAITVAAPFSVTTAVQSISCVDEKDGAITAAATGGFGGYTYNWMNSSGNTISTTANVQGLGKGDYTLVITDALGCSTRETYTLTEPPLYGISFLEIYKETCFQSIDGEIRVSAPDGKFYKLDDLRPWQTDSFFVSIQFQPGTDTLIIYVESRQGCQADTSIAVQGLYPISLNVTKDQLVCPGEDIVLEAAAAGGNGAFTYHWNRLPDGPVHVVRPVQLVEQYEVYALDSNGCPSATQKITLKLPDPLVQTVSPGQQLCFDEPFVLSVTAAGGTGTLVHTWRDPAGNTVGNGTVYSGRASETGNYTVMTVDTCGTGAQNTIYVEVDPPVKVMFDAKPDTAGCAPLLVRITDESTGIYTRQWLIEGQPLNTGSSTFERLFQEPGSFDLELSVTTPAGCIYATRKAGYIKVFPAAVAAYDHEPETVSLLNPNLAVHNRSANAGNYSWVLDGIPISSEAEPMIHLPGEAEKIFTLCLEARNNFGCNDEACKRIVLADEVTVYVPASFTPNGDGYNEIFRPAAAGIDNDDFLFQVYDRWGQLLFETTRLDEGWDGRFEGSFVKSDVYAWKLRVRARDKSEKKVYQGSVTVIR